LREEREEREEREALHRSLKPVVQVFLRIVGVGKIITLDVVLTDTVKDMKALLYNV